MKKGLIPYNRFDSNSILDYAAKLQGHTLREVLNPSQKVIIYEGKGRLGQLVENYYFEYPCNSISEPDFKEVGIELKTTPLKLNPKGVLVSKERLVLNMIDYMEEHKKDFIESSVMKKCSKMLLLFYLHDSAKSDLDLIFKYVKLWEFPEEDLLIIKKDYEKIIAKIKEGKAHELSEGDTFYLGACTKSSDSTTRRKQPFSEELAKPRAFSLKSKYVNHIIEKIRNEKSNSMTSVVGDYMDLVTKSFEEIIFEKFSPYIGLTDSNIASRLGLILSSSKSKYYILAKNIMGVVGKQKIEEFEKADVIMKTIRLDKNGSLKESMSFENLDYTTILTEDWESSAIYDCFTKRFFFVVFKEGEDSIYRLQKTFFWTMPNSDLEIAKSFWEDTRRKIRDGQYDSFITIKEDRMCHVRPKARNKEDKTLSAQGYPIDKKCYWLNSKYILSIIEAN